MHSSLCATRSATFRARSLAELDTSQLRDALTIRIGLLLTHARASGTAYRACHVAPVRQRGQEWFERVYICRVVLHVMQTRNYVVSIRQGVTYVVSSSMSPVLKA